MAAAEREVFIDIERGLRIRYLRSEPPPPVSYAITLEVLEGGEWTTIRLWDNADDVDEHHEHAYTRKTASSPRQLWKRSRLMMQWQRRFRKPRPTRPGSWQNGGECHELRRKH